MNIVILKRTWKINQASVIRLWEKIERKQLSGKMVHLCDNARYYHGRLVKEWLENYPSLLLFPVTLFYFSPLLILEGAAEGLINGSLIFLTILFFSAMVLGRAWCGWAYLGAGLQEILTLVNDQRLQARRLDKWAIWIPCILSIGLTVFFVGGYKAVDFFYQTESGISVTRPIGYMIYYSVLTLFITVALIRTHPDEAQAVTESPHQPFPI